MKTLITSMGIFAILAFGAGMALAADQYVDHNASSSGITHGAFADVNGNFGSLGADGGTPGAHNGQPGQDCCTGPHGEGATGYNNAHVPTGQAPGVTPSPNTER